MLTFDFVTRDTYLALLAVREIRNDADDASCRCSLAGVAQNQQLHDVVVGVFPSSGLKNKIEENKLKNSRL